MKMEMRHDHNKGSGKAPMTVRSFDLALLSAYSTSTPRDAGFPNEENMPNNLADISFISQIIRTFLVLTLWFTAFQVFAQPGQSKDEVRALIPEQFIERQLSGADTHLYKFGLQPNEFFQVRIEQKGIDVILKLQDADGNVVGVMDTPNGTEGPETLTFVAERAGSYMLIVASLEIKADRGNYTIRREPSRTATNQDKRRVAVEHIFVAGVTALGTSEFEAAITKLEAALAGWKELQENSMVAATARALSLSKASLLFQEGTVLAERATTESLPASLSKLKEARRLYQEANLKLEEAHSLNWLASVYSQLGDQLQVVSLSNEALSLFKLTGDRPGEALALTNLGQAQLALGDGQKALDSFAQAVPLVSAMGDKNRLGQIFLLMANIHVTSGSLNKAFEYLSQALRLARESKDKGAEAVVLCLLGGVHIKLSEPQKALACFNDALSLAKVLGDKSIEAFALTFLGSYFSSIAEPAKALDYFEQALPLINTSSNQDVKLMLFTRSGTEYLSAGQPLKAREYLKEALAIVRTRRDKKNEAEILSFLGSVSAALDTPKKALEDLSEALLLARSTGNKTAEVMALTLLGPTYAAFGEQAKALDCLNQALILAATLSDKTLEVQVLAVTGRVHLLLGNQQEAIGYFNKGLSLSKAIGDRSTEALLLSFIGAVHSNRGDQAKALESLTEGLTLSRTVGNKIGEIWALSFLGNTYVILGEPQKALTYLNEALSLAEASSDPGYRVLVLSLTGKARFASGRLQQGLDLLNKALPLARSTGDKINEALILALMGGVQSTMGDQNKAVASLTEALSLTKVTGNKMAEALALNFLGIADSALGKQQSARDRFKLALSLATEIEDLGSQLIALIQLGAVHNELGEPTQALAYLDQALQVIKASGDKGAEVSRLAFLGVVHSGLGDQKRSLEYLNQALPIAKAIGALRLEASVLNMLGKAHFASGQQEQARLYLEQALAQWKVVGDKRGETVTLNNLGMVYQSAGLFNSANDNTRAHEYLSQALSLGKAIGDRSSVATILNNLGVLALNQGQYQKAVGYFNEALPLVQAVENKSNEARVLSNLMIAWNGLNNQRLAVFYGKQAVNSYQQVRTNLQGLDKAVQKTFLQSVEDIYRYLGNILIQQERLSEAQVVLELVKEAEFSGSVRRGVESDVLEYTKEEAEAIDKMNRLAAMAREFEDLDKTSNRDASSERRRLQLMNDLEIGNDEYEKTLKALSVVAKDNESYQEVSAGARVFRTVLTTLEDGAVGLYSVIVRDEKGQATTGWIILVGLNILKAYPIDVEGLTQTVADFRAAVTNTSADPRPLAQQLYKKIFLQTSDKHPISLAADLDTYLKGKKNKTLMWSLDGVLRYVPMAALHDGKQYLVENYRNVVFNSKSTYWLTTKMSPRWTALGLGVSKERVEAGLTFPALLGAGQELKKIIRNEDSPSGILPGVVKENEAFTREAMLTSLSKTYQIVHISSHFKYDEANFDRSFLLLGQGRWSVQEMKRATNLFSRVELVTLSACDTAMGQANGKDAEGFAILAQDLGAKSVIASLWPVDDIGTQVLMPLFYRLRETGKSKAEAFQLAQLALLRGEMTGAPGIPRAGEVIGTTSPSTGVNTYVGDPKRRFAHPYYWAPFILIGNWK
jgi:CHAT domain-containing protein/tetratricopeptide (TPR) repeat protein